MNAYLVPETGPQCPFLEWEVVTRYARGRAVNIGDSKVASLGVVENYLRCNLEIQFSTDQVQVEDRIPVALARTPRSLTAPLQERDLEIIQEYQQSASFIYFVA